MRDAVIVGGGPAGLSAAVVLGRCRRSVLLIDAGNPRNRASKAMHNYLTRDGIEPGRFRAMAAAEAAKYGVITISGQVVAAKRTRGGFESRLDDGRRFRSRKLLLTTGVADCLPAIPGLTDLYGTSVHHCPFCDGYQWKDRRLAAYGKGRHGAGLALALRSWSSDVVLLSGGKASLSPAIRRTMARHGIPLLDSPIAGLEGRKGRLHRIHFVGGHSIERDALFFNTSQTTRSQLARMLGCEIRRNGGIKVDRRDRTSVPGLFVAGDALRDIQFVINAAAQGATAAVAMHTELRADEGRLL